MLLLLFFFDVVLVVVANFVVVIVIVVDPRNLPLKFGKNQVIDDIEFVVGGWMVVV